MEPPKDYDYGWKPPVKLPANLIRLPRTRQGTTWTCGCGALQSMIRLYGAEFDVREDTLVEELKSNSKVGTAYQEMVRYLGEKGFDVTIREHLTVADVKLSIDSRSPILVCFQAWVDLEDGKEIDWLSRWDDGHYAIIIGYDEVNFFFMDPSTLGMYAFVPIAEFQTRWHDVDGVEDAQTKLNQWGLTISRKDRPQDDTMDSHAFYMG